MSREEKERNVLLCLTQVESFSVWEGNSLNVFFLFRNGLMVSNTVAGWYFSCRADPKRYTSPYPGVPIRGQHLWR